MIMSRQLPLDESEKQSTKDIYPTANSSAEPIHSLGEEVDEQALRRVIRKVSPFFARPATVQASTNG